MSAKNFRSNIMGTTSFDGQFAKMNKPQDFIVYPLQAGDAAKELTIQSDNRIGRVYLEDGAVALIKDRKGAPVFDKLNPEELLLLKAAVFGSSGANVGSNGVMYCDNSAASNVFAL